MTGYDRLVGVVRDDPRFTAAVAKSFTLIARHGVTPSIELSQMADHLCGMHGFSAEVHTNAVVFYLVTTRAKHPACIVVALNQGQTSSPSASFVLNSGCFVAQVFEGDADDRLDVAEQGQNTSHWIETKGRVLLH